MRLRPLTIPDVTVCPMPNGIADRQHIVANLEAIRVGKGNGRKIVQRHFDNRDVGIGIRSLQDAGHFAAIQQGHGDLLGILHHVVIGHDQAETTVEDHTGAGCKTLHVRGQIRQTHELPQDRFVEQRILLRGGRPDRDADDACAHLFDDGSKRRQIVIEGRRCNGNS